MELNSEYGSRWILGLGQGPDPRPKGSPDRILTNTNKHQFKCTIKL